MADLNKRISIGEAREMLDSKKISAKELAETYIGRIKSVDGEVKSFITVYGRTGS